jgi:hypothetical protein
MLTKINCKNKRSIKQGRGKIQGKKGQYSDDLFSSNNSYLLFSIQP